MAQTAGYPPKKLAKSGELMLWLGVLAAAVAPIVLGVMISYKQQLSTLAEKGVATEGVVHSKDIRSSSYSGHRGKPRSSTAYLVNFAYDFNASTPYAEWKSTGVLRPSAYPAMTTGTISVGWGWYDALEPGQKEMLIWQPGAIDGAMMVREMEHHMSPGFMGSWYAGLGAAFLAGLWMTYAGWRKRRTHAAR
jgi:hypothetical protein